ncbi:SHOCT domain-containing protein [Streptomyces beihaiensis]|uniref:SHOCT domain-containing protein n=1 Tax=Streptomyces beihaiensis TaxID=2984495 RepID=A0ABT3U1Q2_9ACTN|nr:SHOCT domain-containing protein [Streptomyces beihaiensis]MCX3062185.1 SHOCT domain-containing protein [Streptomyces beihaiensis]
MFWYDHGHDVSGWGWFAMSFGMVLFWAVIIAVGVLLFRALARTGGGAAAGPPPPSVPPPSTPPSASMSRPEQLLAERFARGEIDEDEYKRRLAVLRAAHGPASGAGGQGSEGSHGS